MTIKYQVNWGSIERVTITKETDKCVFVDGRRFMKNSHHMSFYDTWEEAHGDLMADAEQRLKRARRNLEQAQGHYSNIKGMKKEAA